MLFLNSLQPAEGAKKAKTRLGRGVGAGKGKTCGRGHKGQHARAGGYHKLGFEGGQMPLQRRLPKFGFTVQKSLYHHEVTLSDLNKLSSDEISLHSLKESNIVARNAKTVKIVHSGRCDRAFKTCRVPATGGAKKLLEKMGVQWL